MNIRIDVIVAARDHAAGCDRKGYMHRIYLMATSPKWSAL